MADLRSLISSAARPESTVSLCLRGDLVATFERLERSLAEAQVRDSESFSGGEARKILDQMESIKQQMTDSTVEIRLRAATRNELFTMLTGNPPREDNPADKALGYNQDTYYDNLIRVSAVSIEHHDGTVMEVADLSAEEWTGLMDALSFKQFENLTLACLTLNNRDVEVPFSRLASQISQASDGE